MHQRSIVLGQACMLVHCAQVEPSADLLNFLMPIIHNLVPDGGAQTQSLQASSSTAQQVSTITSRHAWPAEGSVLVLYFTVTHVSAVLKCRPLAAASRPPCGCTLTACWCLRHAGTSRHAMAGRGGGAGGLGCGRLGQRVRGRAYMPHWASLHTALCTLGMLAIGSGILAQKVAQEVV
jgi:hypothetical protein